jgi:23S rRNA pseudouridine1911/1915/1917 synthase
MAKLSRTVPAELEGARLDKALVVLFEGVSRARVKRAIEERAVRVNGKGMPKGGVVHAGDVLELEEAHAQTGEAPATATPDAPLTVLFETSKVLVVDKPAGQPTAPLRDGETGTLVNALVGRYPEIAGFGYAAREPGVVHRLDTETSGLVVVARTRDAFDALKDALKNEAIAKEYLLVCASDGLPDDGTIEFPIANHPKDKKRVYPCIHPRDVMRYAPRPALTSYEVVERKGPFALVRARAAKAVRHQIRAHFAALGHPLVGDALYGGLTGEEARGLRRHALHAARVAYDGGGDAALAFDVRSDVPADMAELMR